MRQRCGVTCDMSRGKQTGGIVDTSPGDRPGGHVTHVLGSWGSAPGEHVTGVAGTGPVDIFHTSRGDATASRGDM